MANENAADYGKTPWHWFELECMKVVHTGIDQQKVEDHLHRSWPQVPQHYKDSLVPGLTRLYEAYGRFTQWQVARDNTVCMSLGQWQSAETWQLGLYADQFASADERMAITKKLLAAAKECTVALKELMEARDKYQAQELLSLESTRALEHFTVMAEGAVVEYEQETKDLESILPQLRQAEQAWREQKRVDGDPYGAGWVGVWYLGGGAFGKAWLQVRQDADGNIVDRLVTKDARIDEHMQNEEAGWKNVEGVLVPTEVRAPQMMAGQDGSETILQVRGWREFPNEDYFRVLMEFCPHGDLVDIRCKLYEEDLRLGQYLPRLPEPFLWYVFECLATAGLLMERGAVQFAALQGWEQIYHSDVKLSNIMLRPPNPDKYCNYPSPVMADFGFAQFCPPGEKRQGRGGTPTCESPENGAAYFLKNGQHVWPKGYLNSRSDVWSVGNVIWNLMLAHEGDPLLDFRDDPTPREPDFTDLKRLYSTALIDVVADSMRYYAEDRLSFEKLLGRVRLYSGFYSNPNLDHTRGLHSAPADDPLWQQPNVKLDTAVDNFPLYSKLTQAPIDMPHPPKPPHRTRKLSKDMEYKGRVSADTTSLRRAGSARKHAAAHTWLEHQRWLQRRKKLAAQKKQGGFHVPDSDNDDDDDEEEIIGLEDQNATFEPARIPDSFRANAIAAMDYADGNQQQQQFEQVQDPLADPRFTPTMQTRAQSRSAAAGAAKGKQKEQQGVREMEVEPSALTQALQIGRGVVPKPATDRSPQPGRVQPFNPYRPPQQPPMVPPRPNRRRSRAAAAGAGAGAPAKKPSSGRPRYMKRHPEHEAAKEQARAERKAKKEEERRKAQELLNQPPLTWDGKTLSELERKRGH